MDNRDPRTHQPFRTFAFLAGAFTVLFLGSVVTNVWMTEGAPYPTPFRPLQELQDHFQKFPDAQRVTGTLQFASSVILALFAATLSGRLRRLDIPVGSLYVSVVGGIGASIFLGISALASWGLSQPGVADDMGSMRAMQLVGFASGGVGHTTMLGLLLAGASWPALQQRLMPRWVCWLGLPLAGIAELSTLSLMYPALSPLLPLARFPALVWLIAAGWTLPSHQQQAYRAAGLR